ncbi:MAG TPA: hypothetical protein VNE62_09170 [Actinomycetota bacterium]|nr:hypothetical protein [Actinomycetota bacterium]
MRTISRWLLIASVAAMAVMSGLGATAQESPPAADPPPATSNPAPAAKPKPTPPPEPEDVDDGGPVTDRKKASQAPAPQPAAGGGQAPAPQRGAAAPARGGAVSARSIPGRAPTVVHNVIPVPGQPAQTGAEAALSCGEPQSQVAAAGAQVRPKPAPAPAPRPEPRRLGTSRAYRDRVAAREATKARADQPVSRSSGSPRNMTTVIDDDVELELDDSSQAEAADIRGAVEGKVKSQALNNTNLDLTNRSGGGGNDARSGDATADNTVNWDKSLIGDNTVNGAGDNTPIIWTVIINGDVRIKIKQSGEAVTGAANAAGQTVDAKAFGNLNINASNGAAGAGEGGGSGDNSARSGDAAVNNNVNFNRPLLVGDLILNNSTAGPITWNTTFNDDFKLKIKQDGIAESGPAVAGGQLINAAASGNVTILAMNGVGPGSDAQSGNGGVTNATRADQPQTGSIVSNPAPADDGDGEGDPGLEEAALGQPEAGVRNANSLKSPGSLPLVTGLVALLYLLTLARPRFLRRRG